MDITSVINVLERIKITMQKSQLDISWSSYMTEDDLFKDIDTFICKLKYNDLSSFA